MIKQSKIKESRKIIENSQNPLFLFDNDVDGLISFIILRKAIGKGRGIPIKTFPALEKNYLKRVDENNPDVLIVLDKAEVEEEFMDGIKERNIKMVWIDHHESKTKEILSKNALYVNSLPESEPTTKIAYEIFKRKEDLWLLILGCLSDTYLPAEIEEFSEKHPELNLSKKNPREILYLTDLGKAVQLLSFGLMDTTTNVVKMIRYLLQSSSIYDILEENPKNKSFHKSYKKHIKFLEKQLLKARSIANLEKDYILFSYSGKTSMSSEIANRLKFEYPLKTVFVAFKREDKINISIRGEKALEITQKLSEKIKEFKGGGHIEATGASIPAEKWKNLKEEIKNYFKKA